MCPLTLLYLNSSNATLKHRINPCSKFFLQHILQNLGCSDGPVATLVAECHTYNSWLKATTLRTPCEPLLLFDVFGGFVQLVKRCPQERLELSAVHKGLDVVWVEAQVVDASSSVWVVEPSSCKFKTKTLINSGNVVSVLF